MRKTGLIAASLAAWGLIVAVPSSSDAAVITRTFSVSASSYLFSPPFPVTSGVFTVTWDNSADVTGQTTGISGSATPLTLGSSLAFDYSATFDQLYIGGTNAGVSGINFGTFDYYYLLGGVSGTPTFLSSFYAQGGPVQFSTSGSVSLVTAAPEPASISVLAGALAAMGWNRRRRRIRNG